MRATDSIQVEFTAVPEYVAVARRVAEVVGARAGLKPAALEELQIAVSEVCNRLVNAAEDANEPSAMLLRFWPEADRVVVEIGGSSEEMRATLAHLLKDEFASFLMRRLVDRVGPALKVSGMVLRLEKRVP